MKIKTVDHGSPWTWLSSLDEQVKQTDARLANLITVVEGMNDTIGGIIKELMKIEAEVQSKRTKTKVSEKN